jgi:uncharacterized protein YlxP (DUF503 family)
MGYNQSKFEGAVHIGVLKIQLYLPGCSSLKEKRSRIKPMQERLQREFNVSVAEVDFQDIHQSALVAIALVNNNPALIQASFTKIESWVKDHFRDLEIQDTQFEILC